MTILLSDLVCQGGDPICTEIEGETVMMSIEEGNYYNLNPMGGRIWALIEQPMTVSALCEKLLGEFEVASSQCEAEVLAFLNALQADHLLSIQR